MTSWLKNVFGGDAQVAPQEDEESLISMNRISKIFSRDEGATAATPAPEPGGGLTGRISRMFQGGGENAEPSPQRDGMLAMLGFQQTKDFCGFQLTWKERIYGCLITAAVGLITTGLSILALFMWQFVAFGVLYSFGSICSICCTGFLVGPMTQLKWMFKQRRIFATLGYIGSIILTFIAAFVVNNFIAVLFCVILQFAALGYYIYTYIVPFG